jgi:DNA polymerase-3 subunit delta'
MFDEILGQVAAKEYLVRAVKDNKLANTLLFTGPDGIGKRKTALALATKLLNASPKRIETNTHSDLHIITPEGKSGAHSIDSIRKAIDLSHSAPFEAPAKVFIIELADRMQPAAANALLKTLEEPVLDSYWILLSETIRDILPTILSRCVKLSFYPLAITQVSSILQLNGHSPDLAKFSDGSVSKALEMQTYPERGEASQIILSLLSSKPTYPQIFSALEKVENLVENDDPLIHQNHLSHIFSTIALHFREKVTYQEHDWMSPLKEARLAVDRNMKLSSCLEVFFLKNVF